MYYKHRYNLIRFDLSTAGTAYKLFIKSLYDYVIVKEVTVSDVTVRSYFIGAKDLEANWSNRASLTYSIDIKGRKLLNEGQNWLAAAGQGDTYEYLLDEYSGAAAAYSLRLLSTSYSGDAIVVRRSSDNATQSIGFVDGELDTDTLNTFCSGTDGFVTIWYDQSGSNNNLTQSTAASQPKIYDSVAGVITENGKPAIYTDGIDDRLQSPILSLSNPNTQFVTLKTLSTFGNIGGLYNGQANAPCLDQTPSGVRMYQQGSQFTPTFAHSNNQFLVTMKSSTTGTDWAFFGNGVEALNGGEDIGSVTGNQISLGARNLLPNYTENYLQEYILYNSDQSSNRTGIETNINNFYSIY